VACVQYESKSPGRETETEASRTAVLPSVVPGPAASASPGNLFEMHIPSPAPDLLTVKPYFKSLSGDSGICSTLRTMAPQEALKMSGKK